MFFYLLLSDVFVLLFALAAVACAIPESRQRIFRRGWMLAPGPLATAANVALLSYPHVRYLLLPELWMWGLIAVLIGGARGQFMAMDSDQEWGTVRLRNGNDALVVAAIAALVGVAHFVLEVRLGQVNPYENSVEVVMLLASGYLLGRSVAGYRRAVGKGHFDLHE